MDILVTPDQVNAVAGGLVGLHPYAQVAGVLALGAVAVTFLWTRRPQPSQPAQSGVGDDAIRLVVAAMSENSRSTAALAEQVEKIVEQNAALLKAARLEA
jgi:hypothetical protein